MITDWMMPDLGGLELCRKIPARPQTPYAYFILLTAINLSRKNLHQAIIQGIDGFLQKFLNKETIWAHLHVTQRIVQDTTEIR